MVGARIGKFEIDQMQKCARASRPGQARTEEEGIYLRHGTEEDMMKPRDRLQLVPQVPRSDTFALSHFYLRLFIKFPYTVIPLLQSDPKRRRYVTVEKLDTNPDAVQ